MNRQVRLMREAIPMKATYKQWRSWRSEHPIYRENMTRIGRSFWMREVGLRRFAIVRRLHPHLVSLWTPSADEGRL